MPQLLAWNLPFSGRNRIEHRNYHKETLVTTQQKETPPFPPQHQDHQPGIESEMVPRPIEDDPNYKGSGKLQDKVALITGGDSGIGRAVAIVYAKEGADVAIVYLDEDQDAQKTKQMVEKYGRRCVTIRGDVTDERFCQQAVEQTVSEFGKLDILVNNAAQQFPQKSIEDISQQQLERTFATNIFAYFYLAKAALKHLPEGGAIVNTTSVTAYHGSPELIDYSATKGAIVAFTRSMALQLAQKKIRVNAVAPGPIWTPLIPATFPPEKVKTFGKESLLQRAGQPYEVATSYVFLASNIDSSYMTGQVLHPDGGEMTTS
jgi:NAD(P)-dependent dehydrogenase (short-subunit alcohol dehydrogenase family)